jgi:hypothetical protein
MNGAQQAGGGKAGGAPATKPGGCVAKGLVNSASACAAARGKRHAVHSVWGSNRQIKWRPLLLGEQLREQGTLGIEPGDDLSLGLGQLAS